MNILKNVGDVTGWYRQVAVIFEKQNGYWKRNN
jgi:hypothetical protein